MLFIISPFLKDFNIFCLNISIESNKIKGDIMKKHLTENKMTNENYYLDILGKNNYSADNIFEILLPFFQPTINYYVKIYFAKGEDRDDLYQQGLIGLYKAIVSFKFGENHIFYFHAQRCIKLNILNLVRAANSKKRLFNIDTLSLDSTIFHNDCNINYHHFLPNKVNDPLDCFISNESYTELTETLSLTLSKLEYQVLSCHVNGLSYKEICSTLSISSKCVDNALSRIRKKLRRAELFT